MLERAMQMLQEGQNAAIGIDAAGLEQVISSLSDWTEKEAFKTYSLEDLKEFRSALVQFGSLCEFMTENVLEAYGTATEKKSTEAAPRQRGYTAAGRVRASRNGATLMRKYG